ncbi:MAG: lytic transglycosylase domain-containing protein [Bacteroidales bacterium]|nr:lytic transglycosylase domain-containing protein [Bacteroidales bacterium]
MKKIVVYVVFLLAVVALIFGFDSWRQTKQRQLPGTNKQYYKIVSLQLPDTLYFAGEEVPLELFYVRESLDRELSVNTYWHSSTLTLIKRSYRWFPMIDSILQQNGIPLDFRYLAVIESGLSNVISPANAVGFWQFLKGTAKDYKLEVSKDVDERYNRIKSTQAACAYFLDSYEKFGNWALVAAAYNAGKNGISRRMKKQKASSYYDMLLSDETSRYLYRILAIKLIFESPESYGFYINENELYLPIPTHTVVVNDEVESWADFAIEYGLSYKLLKYFNPWLRQSSLKNRKKKTYLIQIPDPPYDLTHEEIVLKKNGINVH